MSHKSLQLFNALNTLDIYASNLIDAFEKSQTQRRALLSLFSTDLLSIGAGYVPFPGKENEAIARNAVLESGYADIKTRMELLVVELKDCLSKAAELIRALGDNEFQFDFSK